jgi:hypothetical protein
VPSSIIHHFCLIAPTAGLSAEPDTPQECGAGGHSTPAHAGGARDSARPALHRRGKNATWSRKNVLLDEDLFTLSCMCTNIELDII